MASNASPSIPHRAVSTIRTSESTGGNAGSGAGTSGSGVGGSTSAASRSSGQAAPTTPGGGGDGSASTSLRPTPSAYMSPSTIRAEEETIVIELGARQLRIGLAGDVVARSAIPFGPEQQRRVGDLRTWEDGYMRDWRHAGEDGAGATWDTAFELWQLDVRHTDLGLVSDKLERAMREAFTKYLMIDSRPRKVMAVLPPALPLPLISTLLDLLFGHFQSPSVAFMSTPIAATVASGLRHALVVDLGWSETVVTSVYEFHEVACTRSVRAGRMLIQSVHDLLAGELSGEYKQRTEAQKGARSTSMSMPGMGIREHLISFEECEEVATRLVWCKQAEGPSPSRSNAAARPSDHSAGSAGSASVSKPAASEAAEASEETEDGEAGLATVAETDETEDAESTYSSAKSRSSTPPPPPPPPPKTTDGKNQSASRKTNIPLRSCTPPTTLTLSFDQLAEPCETTFMGGTGEGLDIPASWDDDELPIPLLIFQHLLHLPLDVRAICMSRIIFVGGCAKVLGLRARLFDEVARLAAELGWDGVRGKGVAQYKANPKLRRRERRKRGDAADNAVDKAADNAVDKAADNASGRPHTSGSAESAESADPVWHDAANADAGGDIDPVEEELRKTRKRSDSMSAFMPGMQPLQPAGQTMGELRAVETLGPWSGASMMAYMRVPGLSLLDKEQWTQQGGISGAVRPADVDRKQHQRHSVIASGVMRSVVGGGSGAAAASGPANWTLGTWGVL